MRTPSVDLTVYNTLINQMDRWHLQLPNNYAIICTCFMLVVPAYSSVLTLTVMLLQPYCQEV